MKKIWENANVEVLELEATANGCDKQFEEDGTWTQIDGKWYWPGNGNDASGK